MNTERQNDDLIEKLVAVNRVAKVVKEEGNLVLQRLQLLVMVKVRLEWAMERQKKSP